MLNLMVENKKKLNKNKQNLSVTSFLELPQIALQLFETRGTRRSQNSSHVKCFIISGVKFYDRVINSPNID